MAPEPALRASHYQTLTHEHATVLGSVFSEGEGRIAREIMHSTGRYPDHPRVYPFAARRRWPKAKLYLGDYLASEAQPPDTLQRPIFPGYTDILGNNTWGCCGDAMTLHGFEAMSAAAGNPVPPFVTQDCLNLYSAVSGFNPNAGPPGQNPTDQGTDNSQLTAYLQSTGVSCAANGQVYKIAETIDLDPTDDVQWRIGIYEFVAVFTAWALPLSAQGQKQWIVLGDGKTGNSAPGSWGGHDTATTSYSQTDYDTDSWGLAIPVSLPFRNTYCIQSMVWLAQSMLGRTGVSPTGLNWSALVTDYQKLSGGSPA